MKAHDIEYFYDPIVGEDGIVVNRGTVKRLPPSMSWSQVEEMISIHRGKKDHVIDKAIQMALVHEQWEWFHTTYLPCETSKSDTPEPVRPPLLTLVQWKRMNYSMLRKAAFPSIEEQLGMQFDDQLNGTTTWVDMQQRIKEKYPK